MLKLLIKGTEFFDHNLQEFIKTADVTLELEHSLVSLSKWESKWGKPFLTSDEKSNEETLDYIKAMTLSPDIPPEVYLALTEANYKEINEYLNAKMTATWFNDNAAKSRGPIRKEVITSELIYYWMFSAEIPMECEHWHLNRLMTLLRVFSEKNAPPKKMNRQDAAAQRRMLNEQRLAQLNTSG